MRNRLVVLATLVGLLAASAAQAGHHLWDFTEIYSNPSGTTQFVEIFTADNDEQFLNAFTVTAGANTFTFTGNLPTAATGNHWVLIATSNFASLPGGVTPDYIIPGNFFSTGGGTLNYAGGTDVWTYGTVPTDGIHSLLRNGTTAVNSPRNFANQSGSVNQAVATPLIGSWGLVLLVGALLLITSGMLRKRENPAV